MRVNKRFEQVGENTVGQGRDWSLKVKKTFHGLFGRMGNVIVGRKSSVQEKAQVLGNTNSLNDPLTEMSSPERISRSLSSLSECISGRNVSTHQT